MNLVFFDLETQKLFQDVGGRDASKLRLACGVTYSTDKKDFSVYWERDAQALIDELKSANKVIGFNIRDFDYEVLRPYSPSFNFASLRTLDLLTDLNWILGFRIPLDSQRRLVSARRRPPMEFNPWNGFAMASWKKWLNTAKPMWTSRAASMSLDATMDLFIIIRSWEVN